MSLLIETFLFLVLSRACYSAKILAVIPIPSFSHQAVHQPLWKELSLRGHEVTVLTTNPMNDSSLTNFREIDLSFSYRSFEETRLKIVKASNVVNYYDTIMEGFHKAVDEQLQHPEVQKLIHDPNEHFDLLIVEYFLLPPIYFSRRFNCPYIGIFPIDATNILYNSFGNPTHAILNPPYHLNIFGPTSLVERIRLVLFAIYMYIKKWEMYHIQESIARKHFQYELSAEALLGNASLLFVNIDPVFHVVRPLLPSVIPIGGHAVRIPQKPLDKDIRQFLDEAHEGFIYFSLGSNVKISDIAPRILNVILETFTELPYRVLWKCEFENLPRQLPNVAIRKWVPQPDVLKHPNLKLFVTHGGAQSMTEAIHAKIPMVGMPFFSDQSFNVEKIVTLGIGQSVNYNDMSMVEFKGAILEVIRNPKYKNRIDELASLVEDQPMTGLERAVWWTEYVIRHKGAKHLRSPYLDIPWYQFYLMDVILVILLPTLFGAYLITVVLKFAVKLLIR